MAKLDLNSPTVEEQGRLRDHAIEQLAGTFGARQAELESDRAVR